MRMVSVGGVCRFRENTNSERVVLVANHLGGAPLPSLRQIWEAGEHTYQSRREQATVAHRWRLGAKPKIVVLRTRGRSQRRHCNVQERPPAKCSGAEGMGPVFVIAVKRARADPAFLQFRAA